MKFLRHPDVVSVAVIVAAITAWFHDVLFLGRAFFERDIFSYHYPMKRIVREMLLAGEWPMWSPNFGGGQPLAANPAYELFYPPQLLILLPDVHLGMSLHIVVHFYLCAIGLYFLLRSLGAGSAASLLGAIGYVLGGPFVSLARTLPFLFSMAWVPLVFLFIRRFLLSGSRRDLMLAGIAGGMQALVAEPTTMLQTWLIAGAYAAWRVPFRTAAVRVLLAGLISAAIGMAQLLPAADFVRDSVRSERLDWTLMVSKWSLAPSRVFELFYPMYPNGDPFVASFYPGFLLGILFVAGLVAWRRGSGFVLAVCAVSYVLAIGSHTPLLRFLYDVGIFSTMRFAEKFAMGAALVVVIWAALTADLLFRGDRRVRPAVYYVTIGWLVAGLLFFTAGTFVRGAILLALLYAMQRWRSPAWAAVAVAITLVDVMHLRDINPTIGREYFEPPAVTAQLPPDKDQYRIFHHGEWEWMGGLPNAGAYYRDPDGRSWALRNSLMTRNAAWWGYQYVLDRDFDQTYLKQTERFMHGVFEIVRARVPRWREPVMAMSNAWYEVRYRPAEQELRRVNGNWHDLQPIELAEAPQRLPRFYFADQIVQIAGVDDFIVGMRAGGVSPRVAFVETEPFEAAGGIVRSAAQTSRTIALDVEANGRSLLVISVTPHKYWRAIVDGEPADLKIVNIGYQGLELSAGAHRIEIEYWNPLVFAGFVISMAALAGAVLVSLFSSSARS